MLSGNGGDAASSSGGEFQDLRTLNGMQQGTPQERFSVQQPRVQQRRCRANSSEDDAPMAQQQEQPRPQVRSRPVPQARMPSGLNQILQTSDSYGPVRRPPAAGRAVLQRAAAGGAGLRARDSLICQDERVLARRSTRESKM